MPAHDFQLKLCRPPAIRRALRGMEPLSVSQVVIKKEDPKMAKFNIGDHVKWNSEAGHVTGTISKIHTSDFDYKSHTRRASEDAPQYEIESDKTDHIAAHKEDALTKID